MGKRRWTFRLRLTLTGIVAAMLVAAPVFADCAPDRVDLKGPFGQARFSVEIADSEAERARGLMHRAEMARSHGMLFIYPRTHHAYFWMRNTLIPLDMVFLAPDGRITHIHHNAIPLDETAIDGGPGVLAVLEINGGLAAQLGLAKGDILRHPALGKNAAWPCSSS